MGGRAGAQTDKEEGKGEQGVGGEEGAPSGDGGDLWERWVGGVSARPLWGCYSAPPRASKPGPRRSEKTLTGPGWVEPGL